MNSPSLPWQPLRGVRMLDFTWMIAGPLGTRLLANFGAEVIKVESYNRVDRIRETGPHPDAPWSFNEDGSFNDCNTGKRSLLLNLNLPEGQALAKRLVAVCDVAMANFTGNRMDRWGLGYAALAEVNPDLIFLNMPVFESAGERQRWGAIGNHINGLAGINNLSGYESDPPFGLGPLYPDFSGNPYHAMSAITAALIERERGARGQLIEVSQFESTVSLLGPALLQQALTGERPPRRGNASLRACPHNVYRCAGSGGSVNGGSGNASLDSSDRWIAIEVATEQDWRALCVALEREAWLRDPRFATMAGRMAHEAELDALIDAATSACEPKALSERLQAAGVPAAPVNEIDHVLADPWYRDGYFIDMEGPEGCVFTTHGEPIRPFGRQQPLTRAPLMGEHTDVILRETLGISQPAIDALYADGVLA